ncbi:hypothetical protein FQR65_LT01857 [Abscondita terminalis]|nr:hypothetical protein FQR65_LT01857 [Abscondita terminalis]
MPIVPNKVLKNLKCVNCQYWLSYGPIRLLPNGGSICGRCHYVGPRDHYRHFAFEALACYFKFPCINWENHCDDFVLFKKVPEHEKKCKFGSTCRLLCSHPSKACKSPRRLNLNATIKLEMTPDEVLEYLRCSNCAGYLSCSPVYVCRDGTSICHRCTSQIPEPDGEFIRDWCFEVFVDIMIFPCIFRYRGCPEVYQFGKGMMEHEYDCPYGQTYIREQQQRPAKSETPQEKGHKEKGVIKTITGHIYATLTPNAPLFSLSSVSNQNAKQGMFLDEFDRYRVNLASKWGHGQYAQEYLQEDRVPGPTSLIEELKSRQQMKESFRSQDRSQTNYNQHDRQYGNQNLQRNDSFEQYDRQHNSYYKGNPEPHRVNSFAQHDIPRMSYNNREKELQRTNYSVYPSNHHK